MYTLLAVLGRDHAANCAKLAEHSLCIPVVWRNVLLTECAASFTQVKNDLQDYADITTYI